MTRPKVSEREWQDTARSTLIALLQSATTPPNTTLEGPTTYLGCWQVGLKIGGTRYAVRQWLGDGRLEVIRIRGKIPRTLWVDYDHGVTRHVFASAICNAIVGVPYIPLDSRKQAKNIEAVARKDADYRFARGVSALIRSGHMGWPHLDDAQMWEVIEDASQPYPRAYGTYLGQWRREGVPFCGMDVYDDAYHERAIELMATLDWGSTLTQVHQTLAAAGDFEVSP